LDINRIKQSGIFSTGISQFLGFIVIAISMIMIFFVPPAWFSLVITLSIAFAILLFLFNQSNLRLFVIVALLEHVVIIIALSAVVYTKPPIQRNIDKATILVEFLPPPKKQIKNTQQSIPQDSMPDIKMPDLKTKSVVSKYLSSSENDVISSIPTRSKSYKLSPGGLATGDLDKIMGQEIGRRADSEFRLKDNRLSQNNGKYAPSSRFSLPSKGGKPASQGRIGPSTIGRVATGSSIETSNKVQSGGGAFEITGEVSGRKVTYWPEVPEVRGNEVGVVVLEFWVNPEGEVSNVIIIRKAGDILLEKKAKQFVEQIRFAQLPKSIEQKMQRGKITIDFTKDLKSKT